MSSLPVDASHTRTDLSDEPETMCVPSVENVTELTDFVWPFSTLSTLPVEASHTRTRLSHDPETMHVPSVENATDLTSLPTPMLTNDNAPPCAAFLNAGIPWKQLLHLPQGSESRGHVDRAEI